MFQKFKNTIIELKKILGISKMDGTINSVTANYLKLIFEMPYEDLKKMCFLLKKSDNEIYRQFSCKKDQSEVSTLRQENDRLREEVEILKKAAVYFAKELK